MMVEKDSLGTEEDFRAIGLEEDENAELYEHFRVVADRGQRATVCKRRRGQVSFM